MVYGPIYIGYQPIGIHDSTYLVCETVYHGYDVTLLFTALIVFGNQFNRALMHLWGL